MAAVIKLYFAAVKSASTHTSRREQENENADKIKDYLLKNSSFKEVAKSTKEFSTTVKWNGRDKSLMYKFATNLCE